MATFDEGNEAWGHVYSPYAQHSEATIEGNRKALTLIRDAIDRALASGKTENSESIFAADGEGYKVCVSVVTLDELEEACLPYFATYAGGMGQRLHEQELELRAKLSAQMAAKKA